MPVQYLIDAADIYIRNSTNKGNGWAWSQGFKLSTGNYILFSDNDVEYTKDWDYPLIEQLEKDPTTGVVFPLTQNYRDENEFNAKLSGFFWMTRRKTFEEIGDFDPFFCPGNFEDTDHYMRTIKKGYDLVCVSSVKIKHFSRASCDKNPDIAKRYKIHEDYYFTKHSIFPILTKVV